MATKLTRRRLVQAAGAGAAAASVGPWIIREAMGADKIKVASIVDVSGGLDIYGKSMYNCINFAVEEMNKAGGLLGREIRLINYDPQSNIQLYTQYATEAYESDGIYAAYGYFQDIKSPANEAFVKAYFRRFGDNAVPLTELAIMQYTGFQLWAEAVKKANTTDRIKVTEVFESGLSYDGPAGKSTIDAATHHNITDAYIGVVENHKFNVVEKFDQLPPSDTAAYCNLKKNPNDNQQYVIDVKT